MQPSAQALGESGVLMVDSPATTFSFALSGLRPFPPPTRGLLPGCILPPLRGLHFGITCQP